MTPDRRWRGLFIALLPVLLVGCLAVTHTTSAGLGYPAGVTLAQFGLDERCVGEDASCTDRAIDLAAEILGSLGDPYEGGAGIDGARFTVDAQHDPAFEWRAADGSSGTTMSVAVDVTALVRGEAGPSFATLGAIGDPQAPMFVVPDDKARALLDALFVLP